MEPVVHLLYSSDFYSIHNFTCLCMECSRSKTEYTGQFSICFIRSGNFIYNIFRDTLDTYTGFALVNKPGYEYTVTHPAFLPDTSTVIRFSAEFYDRFILQEPGISSSFFKNPDRQSVLIKLSPAAEYLHSLLFQRVQTWHSTRLETDTMVMELLGYVLQQFNGASQSAMLSSRLKRDQLHTIEKAKNYMIENLAGDISLDSLAAHCYTSPFHFSRVFSKITGSSPHQYLLKVRLQHAELLLKSGKPVADTAFLSGFNSLEHFSASFKKHYKKAPSVYRQTQQVF